MDDTVCLYCSGELGRVDVCPICDRIWDIRNGSDSGIYMDIVTDVRADSEYFAYPLSEDGMHRVAADRYRNLVERGFLV